VGVWGREERVDPRGRAALRDAGKKQVDTLWDGELVETYSSSLGKIVAPINGGWDSLVTQQKQGKRCDAGRQPLQR
jgi:hypothetical protein